MPRPTRAPPAFDRAYLLALDDHNRGVAKEIDEYLRFVRAEERAELASLIASTLTRRTPTGASAADFAAGYEHAMAAIVMVEGSAGLTGILPGALENMSRDGHPRYHGGQHRHAQHRQGSSD
jgi:hypothetical protein